MTGRLNRVFHCEIAKNFIFDRKGDKMEKMENSLVPEVHNPYQLTQDDLDSTYWVWDRLHTPPGSPWVPMFEWWWGYGATGPIAQAYEDMPLPLSRGPRARTLRGYHIVALYEPHSDEEVKERAGRYREAIRPWLEDTDKMINRAYSELMEVYEKIKKRDYQNATWSQLIDWVEELGQFRRRWFYWHFVSFAATGVIFQDWEALSSELLGIDSYHPQFQKLMTGFDNRSFETDRRQFKLAQRIIELGLKDIVARSKIEEILPNLEKSDNGKKFVKEFREFLDEFGWRNAVVFSFDTPSWREDPTPVLMRIRQFLANPVFELDNIIAKQTRDRKEAEEQVLNKLPSDQRTWYRILMKAGQKTGVWSEEHSFYFEMYGFSAIRYFWLQIGKRLTQAGALEKPDDIFFLVGDDVIKLLSDPYVMKGTGIAKRRKEQWEEAKNFRPEPYYGNIPFEEAMQRFMATKDPPMVMATQGRPPTPRPELKADVIGIIGSPGVAEGRARVLFSVDQLGEVQPGEILVALATDSAWTPVFSLIKAAVLDTGAPMCHAAIVAREYGIPAILNTMTGTSKIKTGQRIRVDGDVGAVYIVD